MSTVVNEFILRRTNNINAKHLPPKLVQVKFFEKRQMKASLS